jgi:hypothetical protein
MSNLKVGCSPLTNTIYAGSVSKTGLWGKNKTDVTESALDSVAEYLLAKKLVMDFKIKDKWYQLGVKEIQDPTKESK